MNKNFSLKLLPRLQDIFFGSLFAAVLLLGRRMLNLDGDFPRHLLTGKYIIENGSVPIVELFIHPYLNQLNVSHASEWLSDVIFYSIYSRIGLAGVIVFSALLLGTTFTLLYSWLAKRFNLRLPVLALVAWGAMATSLNWVTRPHLISMFLLVIWLIWTDELRRGENISIWKFPLLMLLWANLHGEFIAGILVLTAYCAGWIFDYFMDRDHTNAIIGKKLFLALIFSAIASLINPGGIGPWAGILGFVNNRYLMSRMLEANTPNFQMPEMKVLLGLLAASIFLLAFKREKLSPGQGFLLAGFSALSLMAVRNIHLYGIVAPFVLAETLSFTSDLPLLGRLETTLDSMEGKIRGIAWPVLITIILGGFAISNSGLKTFFQFSQQTFPVQAVAWLESNPQQGKMFNELDWGGYLALHLWPDQLTFIDSMADVTGEVTQEYEKVIMLSEGWQDIFKKYDIAWAIVNGNSDLAKRLETEFHWRVLYKDDTSIILHR